MFVQVLVIVLVLVQYTPRDQAFIRNNPEVRLLVCMAQKADEGGVHQVMYDHRSPPRGYHVNGRLDP